MKTTRRTFLQTLLTTTAAVAAAPVLGRWDALAAGRTPFVLDTAALTVPPLLQGGELRASAATLELLPGKPCRVLAFNGLSPGPTIRVRRGDEFAVRLVNDIDEPLIVHWHGILPPSMMDGHPHHAIQPGETFDYAFTVNQRAGTYFYHPHTHGLTGSQVYRGLAGLFIVDDDNEAALGLPTGEFDIPLLIQDRHFDDSGELVYAPGTTGHMQGYIGDVALLNGLPDRHLTAKATRYRFRLVNGSNGRVYRIVFDGYPFHVIASDGGLLEKPVEMTSLFLAPGERADVLFDCSVLAVGMGIPLVSSRWAAGTVTPQTNGSEMKLLQVNYGGAADPVPLPETLSAIERLDPAAAVATRTFEFSMTGETSYINGLTYDMERIDARPLLGTMEVWELFNKSNVQHPVHIHGVHFQVLSRNGNTAVADHERGWKDTVLLNAWERVRVIMRFDIPGLFLMHCHTLEHEDKGMMINFVVEDPTSVGESDTPTALLPTPNPASDYVVVHCAAAGTDRVLVVVDASGRRVLSVPVVRHQTQCALDVRPLAAGAYTCLLDGLAAALVIAR